MATLSGKSYKDGILYSANRHLNNYTNCEFERVIFQGSFGTFTQCKFKESNLTGVPEAIINNCIFYQSTQDNINATLKYQIKDGNIESGELRGNITKISQSNQRPTQTQNDNAPPPPSYLEVINNNNNNQNQTVERYTSTSSNFTQETQPISKPPSYTSLVGLDSFAEEMNIRFNI